MRVTILPRREEREVPECRDVEHLFRELGLHRDAFIVIRRGDILTRDAVLEPADEVELLPVISGGHS
ncbi:MAG: MoaD/ThiS family protein [Candidatus Dormibacteria bacterium]